MLSSARHPTAPHNPPLPVGTCLHSRRNSGEVLPRCPPAARQKRQSVSPAKLYVLKKAEWEKQQ